MSHAQDLCSHTHAVTKPYVMQRTAYFAFFSALSKCSAVSDLNAYIPCSLVKSLYACSEPHANLDHLGGLLAY
jgi:hypothetical protein